MGLYRRGKIYWYTVTQPSGRVQKSTGTSNRRLAERKYADALQEITEGESPQMEKARKTLFKDMAEKYMSRYQKIRDKTSLNRLLPYFGNMLLSDITSDEVEEYILERAKVVKPSTVRNEYALGRRMFNVARKKWKWGLENPFADVQFSELLTVDNIRDTWLSVEQEKRLLEHATPSYLKSIIIFAIHTGCRRGEILAMTWKDNIDMHRRMVMCKASKGGKLKTIPMSDMLYQTLLQKWQIRHISGKVFPESVSALKDAFERAVKKAGLDGFRFHDLRHTFATRLIQGGVDVLAVQRMMGHSTLKMTARYAHHSPESLCSAIEALNVCYKSATLPLSSVATDLRKGQKVL